MRSERHGHIVTITVDRAKKMNGFTPEMFEELSAALTRLDEDPDLWVGVIDVRGTAHDSGAGPAAIRGRVCVD